MTCFECSVFKFARSKREIDVLRDICSHYKCLLTPLSVIVNLPSRHLCVPVLDNIAWFASTFYNFTPYQVLILLHDFEDADPELEYADLELDNLF